MLLIFAFDRSSERMSPMMASSREQRTHLPRGKLFPGTEPVYRRIEGRGAIVSRAPGQEWVQ